MIRVISDLLLSELESFFEQLHSFGLKTSHAFRGLGQRQHHQHGEVFRDVAGAVPRPLAVESDRGTRTSGNVHSIVRLWS